MIEANEQKSIGYHAYRIAPAIVRQVMDPFLSISVIKQEDPSFARPQAGYTSFFWVDIDSPGGLIIETGTLGVRILEPGEVLALFCGRGVLCRTKPQKDSVRYLQADIKISMDHELLDAHWKECVSKATYGYYIPGHKPDIFVGLRGEQVNHTPKDIQFFGTPDGKKWSTESFSSDKEWCLQGDPLQEPVDIFSSLAMSERVRNRLVLLEYKRGALGHLPF